MAEICHSRRPQVDQRYHEEETQNTDDIHMAAILNFSKDTSSVFPSELKTKLEWTLSTALQNKGKPRHTHNKAAGTLVGRENLYAG